MSDALQPERLYALIADLCRVVNHFDKTVGIEDWQGVLAADILTSLLEHYAESCSFQGVVRVAFPGEPPQEYESVYAAAAALFERLTTGRLADIQV